MQRSGMVWWRGGCGGGTADSGDGELMWHFYAKGDLSVDVGGVSKIIRNLVKNMCLRKLLECFFALFPKWYSLCPEM